jgi:hypothetical protein
MRSEPGLFDALSADGRPLIKLTALGLIACGLFALFLTLVGEILPHDLRYVGLDMNELCAVADCRVVEFMFHGRVSFGGAVMAVGVMVLWLAEFPLRERQPWAWWLLLASGAVGFGSSLSYLGHGYLDKWHAAATLVLLLVFYFGLSRSFAPLPHPTGPGVLFRPAVRVPWTSAYGIGRACLLGASFGLVAAGATIMAIGMIGVFVPQDLAYMQMSIEQLRKVSPRLIPVISHDRASFGGAVCACGVVMLFSVWCGTPSRALWQALCLAGVCGFATAIGVQFFVGYLDPVRLAPAVAGALVFAVGLALTHAPMVSASAARRVEPAG